jgi:ribosomal protein S12 methylthiotransferase
MNNSDTKISLIALGCSKNLVDAECMSKLLSEHGYTIVPDFHDAEIVVINTCGFIESAKTEAINTILEVADEKVPSGNVKFIVVTGCLAQRYPEDIKKDLPEVDAVLGTAHYQDICDCIDMLYGTEGPAFDSASNTTGVGGLAHLMNDRAISTTGYAWLKIGEGCLNRCAFCAIPLIRGSFVSRPEEEILAEARDIASRGYKEIILTAQDTTNYGIDLYKKRALPGLLRKLSEIDGFETIRIMYGYMDGINEELIDAIADIPKVAHYLDIPIQHGSDRILKAMRRRDTAELITTKLEMIRKRIPDIIVRTTVMVGFPGETEEDFETMISNLRKWRFDRLGCFIFSPEEGTVAFDMQDQVPEEIKQARYEKVYEVQKEITEDSAKKRLGTCVKVLIDSVADDGIFYVGRSYAEAPEDDPVIYVANSSDFDLVIGESYDVKLVEVSDYDITGVTV